MVASSDDVQADVDGSEQVRVASIRVFAARPGVTGVVVVGGREGSAGLVVSDEIPLRPHDPRHAGIRVLGR